MAKRVKKDVEILLVNADITGLVCGKLSKCRNLVCVDLVWPRATIARKSAAREAVFRKGKVDFSGEAWPDGYFSARRLTGMLRSRFRLPSR
jgi:hypothetical protein